MSAHPKLDAATGELVLFGYQIVAAPHASVHFTDAASGAVTRSVAVDLPRPAMMHDCGLSARFIVLLDLAVRFDIARMLHEGERPMWFDRSRPSRVGLLPRSAVGAAAAGLGSVDEVLWVDLPAPVACFHTVACWDEPRDGSVVLYICELQDMDFDYLCGKGAEARTLNSCLVRYVVDPAARSATRTVVVSDLSLDFPVCHPRVMGVRPQRYTWLAIQGERVADFVGYAKVDLGQGAVVATHRFPAGMYGVELSFAPGDGPEEDAGWLVGMVCDDPEGTSSSLLVVDAGTMELACRLPLPQRVPLGFHGLFIDTGAPGGAA